MSGIQTQPNINLPILSWSVSGISPNVTIALYFIQLFLNSTKQNKKPPLLWYQGEVVVGTDVHITYNHPYHQFPPRLFREVPSWWFAGSLGRIAESFPVSSISNRFPWIFHNTLGSLGSFTILLVPLDLPQYLFFNVIFQQETPTLRHSLEVLGKNCLLQYHHHQYHHPQQ